MHRFLPVFVRTALFGCDVSHRQPDQFRGRIVAGEVPARLDYLAKARVDALDRIGRVYHPTYLRWEREERNHMAPGSAPGCHHGGELLALKGIELGLRRFGIGGRVDRLDRRGKQFASFQLA